MTGPNIVVCTTAVLRRRAKTTLCPWHARPPLSYQIDAKCPASASACRCAHASDHSARGNELDRDRAVESFGTTFSSRAVPKSDANYTGGQHMAKEHAKDSRTRGRVIVDGDGNAIDPRIEAELMTEVVRFAHRFARRLVRDERAEDLAQEVILELLIKVRQGRLVVREGFVGALVRKVIHRRAVDLLRGAEREAAHMAAYAGDDAQSPSTWASPDLVLEERELEEFHERTLVSLPDTCRRAFRMIREQDASYDVVAEALGVSRSAVHAHVVTAQRRFRRKLAQAGIAAPGPHRGAA